MFTAAINALNESDSPVTEPTPFQEYLEKNSITNKRTAQCISIDSLGKLDKGLRDSNCMVLRLGSPKGETNTHFSLVKYVSGWSDFFFIDKDIFEHQPIEVYLPNASVRSLFTFQILPNLTETSLVNLALASGLLPHALGITSQNEQIIPATGQSTFTFDFKPLSTSDAVLTHSRGQVEIDALFVGQRNGQECIFVVEAKSGGKFDSLAKHKLLYPILALKDKIPRQLTVIPVYLRTIKTQDSIIFNIAECETPQNNGRFGALDELTVKAVKRYSLHGY